MALKRCSGRTKLARDLGLSALISVLIRLIVDKKGFDTTAMVGAFIGGTVGIFCLFFIWSWKNRHVRKDKLVSGSLHTICMFALSILSFWTWLYIMQVNYLPLIVPLIWGTGLAIKYKNLFWPKQKILEN